MILFYIHKWVYLSSKQYFFLQSDGLKGFFKVTENQFISLTKFSNIKICPTMGWKMEDGKSRLGALSLIQPKSKLCDQPCEQKRHP